MTRIRWRLSEKGPAWPGPPEEDTRTRGVLVARPMQPLTGAEGGAQPGLSAGEPLDQVQLLSQPAGCEVVLAHPAVGLQAQPRGLFVILQEGGGLAAEGGEVARVIQQQPAPVVGDLVLDAADPAGQDRARLSGRPPRSSSHATCADRRADRPPPPTGARNDGPARARARRRTVQGQASGCRFPSLCAAFNAVSAQVPTERDPWADGV
jgi:hypothetical protein